MADGSVADGSVADGSARQEPPGHPATVLREALAARGWTQRDLAAVMGRPVGTINQVVRGRRGISPRLAHELAAALGGPPEYWLGLWAAYRMWCPRAGYRRWGMP